MSDFTQVQSGDGVHLTEPGCRVFAKVFADFVCQQLCLKER